MLFLIVLLFSCSRGENETNTFSNVFMLAVHYTHIVMMFKRQRRANTGMPGNTAVPMFLTSCGTEMHIWKKKCTYGKVMS